jgi:hypothetical protein
MPTESSVRHRSVHIPSQPTDPDKLSATITGHEPNATVEALAKIPDKPGSTDCDSDSITADAGPEEADADEIREAHIKTPGPVSALGTQVAARQPQSKIFSLVDRYENGRRYSGYGEYWAPNDEKQNNLLDIAHHLYVLMLDCKLFLAPIEDNPKAVLDIGTGTGIWAMDFADKFPLAKVMGFDLSPVQPGRAGLNVHFEIKDASDPDWGYKKDSFDFIHVRGMAGCISDWPVFYQHVLTLVVFFLTLDIIC